MAKLTLNDIASLANTLSAKQALNENFAAIEEALEDTLSRSGATPNQMESDIDLDSNDILNAGTVDAARYLINGVPLSQSVAYSDKRFQLLTGTGAQVDFVLEQDPASLGNLEVSVDGVVQRPGVDFTYSGTTLTFITAPPATVPDNILVRFDEAVPTGVTNASAVEFKQIGTGMVVRTMLDKARDIVHASDRGLSGDGVTDESAGFQDFLNACVGKTGVLEGGKTYCVSSLGVTIPAGVTLITNGSKIRKLDPSTSYGVTVSDNCVIDKLELEVPGGALEAGVRIAGSNVYIEDLKVTSDVVSAASGTSAHALNISGSGQLSNINVGVATLTNFRGSMFIFDATGVSFDKIDLTNYRTGLYLRDVKNFWLRAFRASGLDPTSVGGPGDNAILVESLTTYSTENLFFGGIHIQDAGEHGFRIGGQAAVRNVFIDSLSTRNTGAAGAGATGGAGFKVLGGSTTGEMHSNIQVKSCVIEDCSTTGTGIGNFAAVQLGLVLGATINGLIVRKRNNPYSCWHGINIQLCRNVRVVAPQITDCVQFAARFSEFPGVPGVTSMTDVRIEGGLLALVPASGAGRAVSFECGTNQFTRVDLRGVVVQYGLCAVHHIAAGVGGAYNDCSVDIEYANPESTVADPPIRNANDILVNYRGPWYGTYDMQASNGSFVQDKTNGLVRIKKAGVWNTL